jgi:ribosomal 30S subunit maturation factor RimM
MSTSVLAILVMLLLPQAELLAGSKLLLALCDRESSPRGRDEFFITDLVGLKALHSNSQELLGIVTEVR